MSQTSYELSIILITSSFVIIPAACYWVVSTVKNRITDETTALYDLERGGTPCIGPKLKGTAVICGGSLAGLWTARICADHFDDVVIVEPEEWLGTKDGRMYHLDKDGNKVENVGYHTRTRVVQYPDQHGFHCFNLDAMKKLFKNAEEELINSSAVILPPWSLTHIAGVTVNANYRHRYPDGSPPMAIFASRACFETTLRRLVCESGSHIRWMVGTVTGLRVAEDDSNRIAFVDVRTSQKAQEIASSLVIDCTGRSHAGIKWIERLQAQSLSHSDKESFSLKDYIDTYTTAVRTCSFTYEVPQDMRNRLPIPGGFDNAGFIYARIGHPPIEHRNFLVTRRGTSQICLVLMSLENPDDLPAAADLIDWVKSLKGTPLVDPWLLEVLTILQENDFVERVPGFKLPPFDWIHYEKIKGLPRNFAATGDAVMTLSPLYGQGCLKACIGAFTLDRSLRAMRSRRNLTIPQNFGANFFKLHAKRVTGMWNRDKENDYQLPGTIPIKGESLKVQSTLSLKISSLLKRLFEEDEYVAFTLWRILGYLTSEMDLLDPVILYKMMWRAIRDAFGIH